MTVRWYDKGTRNIEQSLITIAGGRNTFTPRIVLMLLDNLMSSP
ncbi:hypothetical protein ACWN8V_00030 [Vagococcus elongatus]|nr:hypothetical protein [Vagococcus elongatus]